MDEKDGAVVDGYEEALAARYFDDVIAPLHVRSGVPDEVLASMRARYFRDVKENRDAQRELVEMRPKFAVWDVLVEECGASREMLGDFDAAWPDCGEFRFQGSLGFGGKVYSDRPGGRVACYREDRTPERDAAIARANERLAALS